MAWNGSGAAPTASGNVGRKVVKRGTASKRGLALLAVAIVVLGALATWFLVTDDVPASRRGGDASGEQGAKGKNGKGKLKKNKKEKKTAKESVREAMPKNLPKSKHVGERPRRNVEMFDHLTGEDRRIAEAVQDALDNDDLEKTIAAAEKALTSTNSEVRLNAVDALGWFGARALPELTGAMADADEDIRQTAENHFELAVQDLEKPDEQFAIAMAAFGTLTDEDQLTSLGGIINNAVTEFVDGEEDSEKQLENRVAVVQALVDIIEGGSAAPQNVAAAKELYNDITCNEWMGIDEAERYLKDPENYDPDEPSVAQEQPAADEQSTEAQSLEQTEPADQEQPAEQEESAEQKESAEQEQPAE